MGKVLTVYSPKGGVGKTTLTLALARVLSCKHKVVVVEVDFTPGDMSTILEVETKGLALTQGANLEKSIQCPAQESFDVLTGGFPDDAELASHGAVASIIADLRERYDYVILDTQSYLTESVVAALRAADRLFLVTDESIASVARVLGMVDYLQGNGFADLDRAGLVVNRMGFAASKYVAVAEFPFPTVCRIPDFRRFAGYRDARLAKLVGEID